MADWLKPGDEVTITTMLNGARTRVALRKIDTGSGQAAQSIYHFMPLLRSPRGAFRSTLREREEAQHQADIAEWLTCYLAAGPDCSRDGKELIGDAMKAGFFLQDELSELIVKLEFEVTDDRVRLPDDHPFRDGA